VLFVVVIDDDEYVTA